MRERRAKESVRRDMTGKERTKQDRVWSRNDLIRQATGGEKKEKQKRRDPRNTKSTVKLSIVLHGGSLRVMRFIILNWENCQSVCLSDLNNFQAKIRLTFTLIPAPNFFMAIAWKRNNMNLNKEK